jgi:hypothetical protein
LQETKLDNDEVLLNPIVDSPLPANQAEDITSICEPTSDNPISDLAQDNDPVPQELKEQIEDQEPVQDEEEDLLPPGKAIVSVSSHRITNKGILEYRITLRDNSTQWKPEEKLTEDSMSLNSSMNTSPKRELSSLQHFTLNSKSSKYFSISLKCPSLVLRKLSQPSSDLTQNTFNMKRLNLYSPPWTLPQLLDTLDNILDNWNKFLSHTAKALATNQKFQH